jgi:23S rRNA (guanosine2251-2'-O)-methyltransferase
VTENADDVRVRCPNPECRVEFGLAAARLGKSHPCPRCGQVITVVPIAVRERASAERAAAERARAGSERLARDTMPVSVVLENIRSLWNVGSIFRTSDAAGVEEVILAGYTGRPPRDEIAKTALGAEKVVPWREAATALDAVDELRRQGRLVVALEKTDASVPLAEAELRFPCALVLGNEVAGLTDEVLRAADLVCHLPMHGLKSSLNVAVAAGVALYEIRRAADAER